MAEGGRKDGWVEGGRERDNERRREIVREGEGRMDRRRGERMEKD